MRRLVLLAGLAALAGCAPTPAPVEPEQPVRVVFFTDESAQLDAPARAVVEDAAEVARRFPRAAVRVRAFAGADGDPRYARSLSETRARSVQQALIGSGVPEGRILLRPRGAVPAIEMPLESRRVEIRIGGA